MALLNDFMEHMRKSFLCTVHIDVTLQKHHAVREKALKIYDRVKRRCREEYREIATG